MVLLHEKACSSRRRDHRNAPGLFLGLARPAAPLVAARVRRGGSSSRSDGSARASYESAARRRREEPRPVLVHRDGSTDTESLAIPSSRAASRERVPSGLCAAFRRRRCRSRPRAARSQVLCRPRVPLSLTSCLGSSHALRPRCSLSTRELDFRGRTENGGRSPPEVLVLIVAQMPRSCSTVSSSRRVLQLLLVFAVRIGVRLPAVFPPLLARRRVPALRRPQHFGND